MVKCCDISAGKLRTKIYIERRTRTSDGMGGFTDSWTRDPIQGVFADVRALTGTERDEAGRVHTGNLMRAIIRYRGDALGAPYYSGNDRVIIRGREFGILSVMDIEFRQKYLQLSIFESKPT